MFLMADVCCRHAARALLAQPWLPPQPERTRSAGCLRQASKPAFGRILATFPRLPGHLLRSISTWVTESAGMDGFFYQIRRLAIDVMALTLRAQKHPGWRPGCTTTGM